MNLFDSQTAEATQQGAGVGGGTFLDRAKNWLDQELDFAKNALKEAAAKRFRESETGQEFIAEVKEQEINSTIQNFAPVVGIVALIFAIAK